MYTHKKRLISTTLQSTISSSLLPSSPIPHFNFFSKSLSERSGALPKRRDREVPYGMKGGELNGHKEKGCFEKVVQSES